LFAVPMLKSMLVLNILEKKEEEDAVAGPFW
jgi:hypothetical protein